MATVTSVPGTLDITPDPLQKQSKVQIRRNNKKGRIEIVTSTDSGNNYKTLLPEVTSKVQSGSIPVVQESGDVEWSVLAAKSSTLTGVVSYVNGGTGYGSYAAGDILYANQQGVLAKLPIGSTDQLLTVSNALPVWQDIKLSDAVSLGLMKFKASVRVATTADIPGLSTNTNLLATFDGIAIAVGDRILVKDQTTTSQNGVYQRSADASKYLLKTIAIDASGTGYSINDSLKINDNANGDTAPTFSVTSLKVNSFTLVAGEQGIGVQAGTEYTLTGGISTTPAKYKVFTTKLTEIATESEYDLSNYTDEEERKSLFLCSYLNTNKRQLGNDKLEYRWAIHSGPNGTYQLKGMVYSPAAAVQTAASSGATTLDFNRLTGTDKNARKNIGIASSNSAIGATTISVTLSTDSVIPAVGDIVSLSTTQNINYLQATLTDSTSARNSISQFDAYVITAISGPVNVNVYTITLHTPLTSAVTIFRDSIYFSEKATTDVLLRGFIVGDKFTLGLSTTEYTISAVTQSRTLSHPIGSDVCKYGALSGSITFTPQLSASVPVNTTIRYIGKAIPGTSSNSYPIKSRSTALPSSASFPLTLDIVAAGMIDRPLTSTDYPSPLDESFALDIYSPGPNVSTTIAGYTQNEKNNNSFKLVPKCGVDEGRITDPGVFTEKPNNGKLTFSDTALGVSFNTIGWAVNAISIVSGGLMALNTRATFGTVYVTSGTGTGLTLKTPTYQLQNVATFSRTADADTWAELSGSAFKVTSGTVSGGSIYFCDSRDSGGVIGTTAVSFTKIAGITTSSGSTSLTNTGAGDNVLQDEPILNDPVIKIRVAQSGNGSFSFGAGPNYTSYTLKLPTLSAEDTIVARDTYDVLNNKTLIRPFITSINTGPADGYFVSTLPQQTTTLVGTDTTDTLTNKTIESAILTGDTTLSSTSTFTPAAGATLDLSAANVILPSSTLSGFGYKAPVRAATTASIALSGTQTIDDVALVAGDRVLVKNQSPASGNGIYIVNASTWTRSTDLNVWSEASAAVVVVQEGTLNQDTVWLSTANASGGTIGSTNMPWGMIGVDQTGSGLTTQVLVGGGDNIKPVWTTATGTGAPVRAGSPTFTGIPLSTTAALGTNDTQIATTAFVASVATLSSLTSVGTLTGGTWNASVIAGQYGGTGVNNTGKTITLGGNLTTTGNFTTELITTAATSVTLPTSGTLVNTAVTTLSSLTSVGTITTGTWSGSFGAVSGASLTNLTAGSLTGTIPSGVLGNSSVYIGTTSVALNRTSSSLNLTGINIDGSAATVTGAAQAAITSVGTLTSLSVNGAITINGNSVITAAQPSTSFPGSITLSGGSGSSNNGGSINTSSRGGNIDTSGNNSNGGGYIKTSGWNNGTSGNNGGYIDTSSNGNNAGGFINTTGNGSGVTLPTNTTGGGYIYTGGNTSKKGGDINTSASTSYNGGGINTSGGTNNNGGYIDTSNNGGYMNTAGNGSRGGFIVTSGNTTTIPTVTGNGGGYIFTACNNGGNGGNINTSGFNNGSASRTGGDINTSATAGNNGGSINTTGNNGGAGGNIDTSNNGGYMNTTGNMYRGGFINTAGNGGTVSLPSSTGGGYIYTAGNNGGNGGNINTSGFYQSPYTTAGGDINTSAGNNSRGGFINTSGNITSIPVTSGNGGGYIFTAGNNGGNGGNINTSGFNNGSTVRTGGDINTSATGGNNGGSINTSGNTGNAGGNINTSGGGGSINTGGTIGNIELGIAANRTVLKASGVACSNINLPSTNNSVIMCNKDTAINLALVSSFF